MKLPANAKIAREKLIRYLLVKRPVGDKSEFLKQAGYTLDNPERLEEDIRRQILILDAVSIEKTNYGELFEIRAFLAGPIRYDFKGKNGLDAGIRDWDYKVHNLVS